MLTVKLSSTVTPIPLAVRETTSEPAVKCLSSIDPSSDPAATSFETPLSLLYTLFAGVALFPANLISPIAVSFVGEASIVFNTRATGLEGGESS